MANVRASRDIYRKAGFVLARRALRPAVLDGLEEAILALLTKLCGKRFASTRAADFAIFLLDHREIERQLYDEVRALPVLEHFCLSEAITARAAELLDGPIGLLAKIPVRIDLPNTIRELAVWHQDYHYVRGNEEIVTAWVPLQDTRFVHGCLMVMPGSHKLGVLKHDTEIRHFPSTIFEREVRYVEMERGDLLFFSSLLLHSSGLNLSDRARLSIQARYSPLSESTDPAMGTLTPVVSRVLA
jgi:ectoine hydroxylase-related dioxygenase (phytanoyl-CoA dioxygenase family)